VNCPRSCDGGLALLLYERVKMATIAHIRNTDRVSLSLPNSGAGHARLRTRAAAEYTALSPRTLEAFRVKGGGPRFIRIGRAVIYDTRDLDHWLAARTCISTSDAVRTDEVSS